MITKERLVYCCANCAIIVRYTCHTMTGNIFTWKCSIQRKFYSKTVLGSHCSIHLNADKIKQTHTVFLMCTVKFTHIPSILLIMQRVLFICRIQMFCQTLFKQIKIWVNGCVTDVALVIPVYPKIPEYPSLCVLHTSWWSGSSDPSWTGQSQSVWCGPLR